MGRTDGVSNIRHIVALANPIIELFSWLKENSKLQGPDWLEAAGMLSRSGSNAANQ